MFVSTNSDNGLIFSVLFIQQNGGLPGGSSQFSHSPASSPVKASRPGNQNLQQGTNSASTNQYSSPNHVIPQYYRSPDKAGIASQSNPLSSVMSSPRKQHSVADNKAATIGHGSHSYSRQRAPDFGRSDVWTEL